MSRQTAEPTTGTCATCHETVATFLFGRNAAPPWWYAVVHGDEDGDPSCAGSGYPVLEQEKP